MIEAKVKTPLFLVAASCLTIGSLIGYNAKTDTVRAGMSEPITEDAVMVLEKTDLDAVQAIAYSKYAEIAKKREANAADLEPCVARQQIHIAWLPTTPAGDVCKVRAIIQVDIPGIWVAGKPEGIK